MSAAALRLARRGSGLASVTFAGLAFLAGCHPPRPPSPVTARRPAGETMPGPTKSVLVPFTRSAFPYEGEIPEKGTPFLDVAAGGRHGHTSPRGGLYWEDETYNDRRVLLSIPAGFRLGRPALIVVFFHGNQSILDRDVDGRQEVPRQVEESGLNAVLVAPQMAVDALDSSAGHFWERGMFAGFLDEAADRLAELSGQPRARQVFRQLPVLVVAYSGGYNPAAFVLERGGAGSRVRGVLLLDALSGEIGKFADWVTAHRTSAFFVSSYSRATQSENAQLQGILDRRHVPYETALPVSIQQGVVAVFDAGPDAVHTDFVTRAWAADPLKVLLSRVSGFRRI